MMRKYIFIPIIMILVFACNQIDPPREISRIPIGKIIDVVIIPTSFNMFSKTQIKTKTWFIVIYGLPSVIIGAQAYIITYDRGSSYLTWDKHRMRYQILGNV